MANLDEELKGYYDDQDLDDEVLDKLMAMEKPKRRSWLPWVLLGGGMTTGLGVAAAALISVTLLNGYQRPVHLAVQSPMPHNGRLDTGLALDGEPSPVARRSPMPRGKPRPSLVRPSPITPRPMPSPMPEPAEPDRVEGRPVLQTQVERTPTRTLSTSTFGVDTDSASWSRAYASLTSGRRPDSSQVRTEEFINAFHYDYQPPAEGPFSVNADVVPSPFDTTAHLVRIGLQGKKVSVFDRKPVHLTFLVDVSGSMSAADKLPLAQYGMKKLVGQLRDTDTVAIVTYAGSTGVRLKPTRVSERDTILSHIEGLLSGGSTSMGAGIDLAYGLAEQTLEPGAINRVVLISDGNANVGERNADKLARRLRSAADKGITLTTLGFGNRGYRDDVMERLANKGDGEYHWIGSEREAKRVLVDDLTGMLQTIARDVKIQVSFDPKVVSSWRLIGYENRRLANRDFRNDKVDAGEVGAGHQVTALYEVVLAAEDEPLGALRLRYEAPGAQGSPATERSFSLVGSSVSTLSDAPADTRLAVVAATFAERLRGREGPSYDTLLDLLPDRPEYRERDQELAEAIGRARDLPQQPTRRATTSPDLRVVLDPEVTASSIEVRCGSGYRSRSAFRNGVAILTDVPSGRCTMMLKGSSVPQKFWVVAGETYHCSGTPTMCRR